jgi:hypothetical protein
MLMVLQHVIRFSEFAAAEKILGRAGVEFVGTKIGEI